MGLAKLGVGLASGSLGVIADAAHSGLDLIAAAVAYIAIRWAERPPDASHPFGHGRGESVAAFLQSILLLLIAIWIGVEAISRILTGGEGVRLTPWTFGIMIVSIGASFWRFRASQRAALRYQSAALEAAAVDFSADVRASLVVLLGLAAAAASQYLGRSDLASLADAAAGFVVAAIVGVSSAGLAREAVDALVDRSPEDLARRMTSAIVRLPGVIEVRRIRLRRVGARYFADVVAVAPRTTTLIESHALSEEIERAIQAVEPRSDSAIHLEPGVSDLETIVDRTNLVARELGVQIHDVGIHRVRGRLEVDLHVEVDPSLSLDRAHAVASELERRIVTAEPRVREVNTHLESAQPAVSRRVDVTSREPSIVQRIQSIADQVIGSGRYHHVRLYREITATGEAHSALNYDVVLQLEFPPDLAVTAAHEAAERLERALRDAFPHFASVLVHVEPPEAPLTTR